MGIKRIRFFTNDKEKSYQILEDVSKQFLEAGFDIVQNNEFDLGIAIGGDGTFLKMINECNFLDYVYYVGINAGTLGFAQDIEVHEVPQFIQDLLNNQFFYEDIAVETIDIHTGYDTVSYHCLNEVVIRDKDLHTLHFDLLIDDVLLEEFAGDGMLISTSFGSTAYNLSFGGSMVCNAFDTLQLTPIAPIRSKSYPCLVNSLILPSFKRVTIIPKNNNSYLLTMDGRNTSYSNITSIDISIQKHISLIRKSDYNYIRKINDKFVK
ncbi:MAG: NAD(+)/NADH kinase [Bacilli bacterium]|nr:NAD(+)/NADH kinase [Bacilli bacterium]